MSASALLEGAFDLHVHAAPSIFPRYEDDLALVREAARYGIRGIVLKAHEGSTAERAALLTRMDTGVTVVGAVVLNHFVGGLNPFAVEVALELGARVVWFPTVHSRRHLEHYGGATYSAPPSSLSPRAVKGLSVFDESGAIRPEVYDILDLIAGRDAVLATGHLDTREALALIRLARQRGVQRIVATHPDFVLTRMPLDVQEELTRLGAYVEKTALSHRPDWEGLPLDHFVAHLSRLDPGRVLITSDFGQRASGPPYPSLSAFLQGLLDAGLDERIVSRAVRENARELLS